MPAALPAVQRVEMGILTTTPPTQKKKKKSYHAAVSPPECKPSLGQQPLALPAAKMMSVVLADASGSCWFVRRARHQVHRVPYLLLLRKAAPQATMRMPLLSPPQPVDGGGA